MPRLDRQHKEYHINLMGLPVYFASSREGSVYWRDMCWAWALVMRDHDAELLRKRVGSGTGVILLSRLAVKWMPEPWKTELDKKYLMVRQIRQNKEAIEAANAQEVTE
jgi:hypothetical protein